MKAYRRWILKRRVNKAIWALQKVDRLMKDVGMSRHQRKQLWSDFIRSEKGREGVIGIIEGMKA